jgi:mannonate dehydratase
MVMVCEMVEPHDTGLWPIVAAAGISGVVTMLAGAEQQSRFVVSQSGAAPTLPPLAPKGERPWELAALRGLQERYADAGFRLVAVEDTAPMDAVRLGRPGRDEQVEHVIDQIRAMGQLDIGVLCYNWMALTSWARTDLAVPLRGGAVATGYDDEAARSLPVLPGADEITEDQLWAGLEYFLRAVVPVAEESGVTLGSRKWTNAMRPIPPNSRMTEGRSSVDNYRRVLKIVDSPASSVTLCQGNFCLMTDDLPSVIREFGGMGRIAFVHFRDVRGDVRSFVETFHDEGKTDLLACMRAYGEVGFTGPLRPDHVPTLPGEDDRPPGYGALGRLFAVGYIKGLRESVFGRP